MNNELLDLLNKIWNSYKYKEYKFLQLIEVLQFEFSRSKEKYRVDVYFKDESEVGDIKFTKGRIYNLFYVEDDDFIEFLKKKLEDGEN